MQEPRVASRLKRLGLRLGLGAEPFGEAMTEAPETIEFAGAPGDPRPAVEIYLGTHPSMLRATRVLARSLAGVRDPSRRYRLQLMSNLRGVPREGWSTGWEGYARETPRFAGDGARALWLDATHLFLEDPAPVFDAAGTGVRNLVERPWPGAAALAASAPWRTPRGAAPPAGEGPEAARWRAFEAAADLDGFRLFAKARPSGEHRRLIGLYQRMHEEHFFPGGRLKHHVGAVRDLIARTGARTVLDYGAGKAEGYQRIAGEPESSPWRALAEWPGVRVRCYDPGVPAFAELPREACDGVISTDVVEHLAPFDAPWILDEMFGHARRFVFVVAAAFPAIKTLPDGRNAHTLIQPAAWWRDEMDAAAFGREGVIWRLACDVKGLFGKRTELAEAA